MSDITTLDNNRHRKEVALLLKRKEILAAPPEKALDMILSSDLPATLVQSFSEQDLYFLSHSIGIADALPVLALATSEQWGYILDVEIWTKDTLDLDSVTRWMRALLLADGRRLVNWLLMERLEFFELYLFRNIEVIVREENEDPSDFPDGYFTVDDYFYVRVKEKPELIPTRSDDEMISQDDLDLVVRELLEKILEINHGLYQSIMLESMGVIGPEVEEETLRMRNVRLAEQGFLPFDEALEIFSPLDVDQVEQMAVIRNATPMEDEEKTSFPLIHMTEVKGTNRFTQALSVLDDTLDLGELEMEFAALCNQIISADQNVIREKETLSKVVKKAVDYVSIGLEILEGKREKGQAADSGFLARLMMKHSLKNLFRLGVGRVLELRHQAERLRKNGWFKGQKLPLSFWGETYVGVIGGLLVKRPVFYDPVNQSTLYREFECVEDIEKTERILKDIKNIDDLLAMVSPRLQGFREFFPTYANVLLTIWVHRCSGHGESTEGPVSIDDFRSFFHELWTGREPDDNEGRAIREERKKDFLDFLARRSGFKDVEISEKLGAALEDLFKDLEKEYGAVNEKDLDPRYIVHFCIIK